MHFLNKREIEYLVKDKSTYSNLKENEKAIVISGLQKALTKEKMRDPFYAESYISGYLVGYKEQKLKLNQKKLTLVKRGNEKGYPLELIADMTGLSIDEIEKL